MKFAFSTEQEEFRSNLRRLLAERSPSKEVRRLMETEAGWERDGWRKLNSELGLTALRIPEAYDGQGFGFGELGIVLEEMGRALVCAPYFSTSVLATGAILNAGKEADKQALLPGIAAGDTVATLAWVEDNGRWDAAGTALTVTPSAGSFRLDGHKTFVLDGHTADLLIVLARAPGTTGENGLSLFTVAGDAKGLTRRALKTMDWTRKLARLEFEGVEAKPLGEQGGAAGPFARTMTEAAICLANEMAGVAERCARIAGLRQDAHAVRPADRLLQSMKPRRPTCWSMSSSRNRRPITPRPHSTRPTTTSLQWRRWPRPPPARPACRRRSTPSRSMAASASPGTTTPISGSSAPKARRYF
jgi:alkylation response protein AidB-like acyl-CoA dehydrogenase